MQHYPIPSLKATHADRLERWLGSDNVSALSAAAKDFYWPVPVQGVPCQVFVMPGGDFAGAIEAGQFCTAFDRAEQVLTKLKNRRTAALAQRRIMSDPYLRSKMQKEQHAFASMSALIASGTNAGKTQQQLFQIMWNFISGLK